MKGMFIQCGSCSFVRHIDLEGRAEAIEPRLNEVIEDGWRYVKSWDDYICPDCRKNGTEYESLLGKPKAESKAKSYKQLLFDAGDHLRWL